MSLKRFFENWRYRLVQFQGVLAPVFYVVTLTLLVYPYVNHRLDIDGVKGAMAILALVILSLVMLASYVWVDILEMWRVAQEIQVMKRNQFSGQGKPTNKDRFYYEMIHRPIMVSQGLDTQEADEWLRSK